MGNRHGPSRRTILMGAVVAGLILALAVPAIALGALNPAVFYSYRPGSGSSTTNTRPTISVTGYDGYGVRGSTAYSATLDGISVRPRITYYTGYGYKKFTLTYVPTTALSSGSHKFGVSVKDTKGRRYGTSWSFTVQGDTTAPVTTASTATSPGLSQITLSATDSGSGVGHTYYRLDGAAQKEGTLVVVDATGVHTLEYWSVDKAGNTEVHRELEVTVVGSHATPALWCTAAGCHVTDLATIHVAKGCAMCHDNGVTPKADCVECHGAAPAHPAAHDAVESAIAENSAGCVSCHGGDLMAVLPADNPVTHRSEHSGCSCHVYGEVDGQTACEDCHVMPMDPSAQYPYHVGAHAALEAGIAGTRSSACTACHGTNLQDVSAGNMHIADEHQGCSCHAFGEATPDKKECADCHEGPFAPHGFVNGFSHTGEGWIAASGHNTTTYGTIGGYSKFDGSQGVVLKDTEEDTITTNWSLPQRNVFWGASDPEAPATAIKGLNWTSVITCQDCHTGLNASGPHGAAQHWGIDPNYPGPYKYAVLGASKKSTAATSTSGIKLLTDMGGTLDLDAPVAEDATIGVPGIQDGTSGPYAVICAKCHDLFNPPPGYGVNSTTTLDNGWSNAGPDSYEGLHGAHAGGTARNSNDSGRWDGRSDCVACHIGVPHGWKRPRLLVNAYTGPYPLGGSWNGTAWVGYTAAQSVADPAPYNVFRGVIIPEQSTTSTVVTAGNGPSSAVDDHSLNAFGLPVWDEAACVSCAGGRFPYGLEHNGITSEPAKIK